MCIETIHAREVLDSRGRPTVKVEIAVARGWTGSAIVPSGASTGSHEAIELRDRASRRLRGRGVWRAVDNVNSLIAPCLISVISFIADLAVATSAGQIKIGSLAQSERSAKIISYCESRRR